MRNKCHFRKAALVGSLVVLLLMISAMALGFTDSAAAQVRTTGEIRGRVFDPSSAVVPGATIQVKDLATGVSKTTTSDAIGTFVFLNLQPGVYELTASLTGFQTAVIPRIVVETARTSDVDVHLRVGTVSETVEVTAIGTPVLETTSNTVSTTVRNDYIQNLPFAGRDTLQFALLMAGSQTIDAGRTSTFNGLPNASLNISLDGMNNNSQRFKSGGTSFFAFAPIRLDAIEEVTVSTTGSGADASAGGAMQIRFVTRRGTNEVHFKLFEQFRNDWLNANSFFNNARGQARAKVRQNDFGGNIGGPLPIPFVPRLKNKLFFFVNFEATPLPGSQVSSTSVLTPEAQAGIYSYIGTDNQPHSVNVLQLAAARGYQGTVDPTVAGILKKINDTTSKGTLIPSTTDLNHQTLLWRQPTNTTTFYPTARLDYQISPKLAWRGTWNLRSTDIDGTSTYPDLTPLQNAYKITTYVATTGVDWTITPTMLNAFNFGVQSNGELFYKDTDITQWKDFGHRRIHLGSGVSDVIPNQVPWIRNNPVYNFSDTLNWVRGKHTLTFGGSLLHTSFYETTWNSAGVLDYNIGVASGDPITSVLSASVMPFIRSADVAAASALYATLTGRLSSITGSRNVDEITHQYADFASITQRFAFTTGGFFFQDSFRVNPALTLNYGLRWELSGAIHNTNKINTPPDLANFFGPSKTLFRPGVLDGVLDPQLNVRPNPYKADKVNPAPNFGFAWNPSYESGLRGKLFGKGTVIRASYGINYFDEGINTISNRASSNPGTVQSINLQPGMPGFSPGGLSLTSTLPAFAVNPPAFSFPMPMSLFTFISGLQTTKPELHTPYVQNWTFGIQRELASNMALEVRYVGNKSTHMWHSYSVQETNIFENGFLQEFINAQRNLAISVAQGRGNRFDNQGLPGQVPLPIFEAAFGARGSIAALPLGSGFTNGTFITNLQQGTAGAMANSLASSSIYLCRMVGNAFSPCASLGYDAPGPYPMNFFRPNPFATNLTLVDDNGNSTYHGLQIELRKRYSHGLTLNANYTWSKTLADMYNATDQSAFSAQRTLRNHRLDRSPTPFDLRHVFQTYWTYELPFGPGHKFLTSNRVAGRILGGWTLSGIHKITSGRIYQLSSGRNTFNNFTDSGVVLSGITRSDLQKMMTLFSNGPNRNLYFVDTKLIGADGRANPQYLAPPTTPGVFNDFIYLYGPKYVATDLALLKEVPIWERLKFTFQVEMLNAFNHPVFAVGTTNITSTSFGQTTGTQVGPRNIQLRASLSW